MKQESLKMKERCKQRFAPVVNAVQELLLNEQFREACFDEAQYEEAGGAERENAGHKPILIGIDGMCATGKTTLGYYLKEQFGCNLFHMDDFFLRPEQRTPERMAEIGGNVDYERFREEVLMPIRRGEEVWYRPYCCQTGEIGQAERIPYKRLNIVEGSYSLHPFFEEIYDLRVFTESTYERQIQNVRERNGEVMLQRFVSEWIPKEEAYFEKFRIQEGCMVVPWMEQENI